MSIGAYVLCHLAAGLAAYVVYSFIDPKKMLSARARTLIVLGGPISLCVMLFCAFLMWAVFRAR